MLSIKEENDVRTSRSYEHRVVRGERQALAVVTARLAAIGSEQEEDASRQERGQAPHREVSKRLHEERV